MNSTELIAQADRRYAEIRGESRGWGQGSWCNGYIQGWIEHHDLLRDTAQDLISVLDAAGLLQLSRGVELGQTVWYVKATAAKKYLEKALAAADLGVRLIEEDGA